MRPPITVLYVNHVSQVSGAEESLLALMSRLDRAAFSPVLACPPGELAERAAAIGVPVHPVPLRRLRRTWNPLPLAGYAAVWPYARWRLGRIARQCGAKLLHANSPTAYLYASGVAARLPSVWHSRDLRPLPLPALAVCRCAERIIAVSEAVADFLSQEGLTRPRVTRIYNGIDAAAWRARVTGQDPRPALGLDATARVVLMPAQFVPWKRHEDALRMMVPLLVHEPAARLVLAGSDAFGDHPKLEPVLRALAAGLGIGDKVVFAGARRDMPDLMATAEIVLAPSDGEPFGRVAIEAMCLAKPVVGTRAGGLPEVVRDGETGLLTAPCSPDSLATACARLMQNRGLARTLGEAGYSRVLARFDIDHVAQETQTLYEAALHPPLRFRR
jgi:glycosyltransferase involved in cell wall biosynthesis